MILKSIRDTQFLYIDWWIHNHCNYNCLYCADIIKNGRIDYPNLENAVSAVEQINQYAKDNKKICNYYITGGEATMWPFLIDLLEKIKYHNSIVKLRSNGSLAIDEWNRMLDFVDYVNLEYHPEFSNPAHFIMSVNSSIKKNKLGSVLFNMIPERWDEIDDIITKIKNIWEDAPIKKKILFNDPVVNQEIKPYEDEQIKQLSNQSGDLIFTDDNQKEIITDYQRLIIEKKNKFINYQCMIGVEQIVIDAYGRVGKGHCRVGGYIGRLGGELKFSPKPVQCIREYCINGFDIQATKIKSV
jgi:MoaA/NifB/PqqE/SkfB family radical SAM enzyme